MKRHLRHVMSLANYLKTRSQRNVLHPRPNFPLCPHLSLQFDSKLAHWTCQLSKYYNFLTRQNLILRAGKYVSRERKFSPQGTDLKSVSWQYSFIRKSSTSKKSRGPTVCVQNQRVCHYQSVCRIRSCLPRISRPYFLISLIYEISVGHLSNVLIFILFNDF